MIVVTDMRMPGMDGAQLLQEVWKLYPTTVRIILSGYSDDENNFKSVKLAHQYLSKPCRPVDIIQAIDQSLRLHEHLAESVINSITTNLDSLPVLHPIYTQLVEVLQNENATNKEVGDIIAQDMGMCASILRLVNSAFFGMPVRVSSIHHAVELLGSQTLRILVLYMSLFAALVPAGMPDFSVKMLWEHSLRVALFAKAIGEKERLRQEKLDDCFIAGSLHDIGKLILATKMRPEFNLILSRVRSDNIAIHEVEREIIGATHAEVGAYLMAQWGFNNSTIDAICWHHCPKKISSETFSPLMAVAVANHMDHELVVIHQDYGRRILDWASILDFDLSKRLDAWREICAITLSSGVAKTSFSRTQE